MSNNMFVHFDIHFLTFAEHPFLMNKNPEWFETWFDSPYYHVLYDNRNPHEAQEFLNIFFRKFEIKAGSRVLDLACGAGRHSRTLHAFGLEVYGIDLSPNNVQIARTLSHPTIQFEQGDMRNFQVNNRFDLIFNIFTSFGYFKDLKENIDVLKNCHHHLLPNGRLIIDYFNSEHVLQNMVEKEVINKGELEFSISKTHNEDKITKVIEVLDQNGSHVFEEVVQLISLKQFEAMAHESGFQISGLYGSYDMSPFIQSSSPRLILILDKK